MWSKAMRRLKAMGGADPQMISDTKFAPSEQSAN